MTTILCNLSDANRIITEERDMWVKNILSDLGVPEEFYDIKSVDEFREKMDELGIEVMLNTGGTVDIYKKIWHNGNTEEFSGWLPATDECLVAQWKEPTKKIKIEGKDYYYEIQTNEWTATRR